MPIIPIEELQIMHRNICQAVGDPKRIQILYALHDNPMNVSALAAALDTPQPTISRHLALLRQRSLVHTERNGTEVIYSIAEPRLIEVLDTMRTMLRDMLERQTNTLDS